MASHVYTCDRSFDWEPTADQLPKMAFSQHSRPLAEAFCGMDTLSLIAQALESANSIPRIAAELQLTNDGSEILAGSLMELSVHLEALQPFSNEILNGQNSFPPVQKLSQLLISFEKFLATAPGLTAAGMGHVVQTSLAVFMDLLCSATNEIIELGEKCRVTEQGSRDNTVNTSAQADQDPDEGDGENPEWWNDPVLPADRGDDEGALDPVHVDQRIFTEDELRSARQFVRDLEAGSLSFPGLLALKEMVRYAVGREHIVRAGHNALWIRLLRTGSEEEKVIAAAALHARSTWSRHQQILVAAAGAIPLLAEVLRSGTAEAQEHAAGALWGLMVQNETNRTAVACLGVYSFLVWLLWNGTEGGKVNAAGALKSLTIHSQEIRRAIVAAGAVPALVYLLQSESADAQEAAAGALRSLCVNIDEHRRVVAEAGAIPPLVRLLRECTAMGVRGQGLGALWELALERANKKTIAAEGAIPVLVQLLRDGTEGVRVWAARALRTVVNKSKEDKCAAASAGAITALAQLLSDSSAEVKIYSLRALTTVCSAVLTNMRALVSTGALPVIVQMFKEDTANVKVKESAAHLLWALAQELETHKSITLSGAIPALVQLLQDGAMAAKVQAAGALNALAHRDRESKLAIAAAGAVPYLVQLLTSGLVDAQAHAASVLQSLCVNINEHRKLIAAAGAIPALLDVVREATGAKVVYEATSALFELSLDADNCQTILAGGAALLLVPLLSSGTGMGTDTRAGTDGTVRYALRTLRALCQYTEQGVVVVTRAGVIPQLVGMLRAGAMREQTLSLLARLCANNRSNADTTVQAGAVPLLVRVLIDGTPEEATSALEVLGWVAGSAWGANMIIAEGGVQAVARRLKTGSGQLEKAAVVVLWNLVSERADSKAQLSQLDIRGDLLILQQRPDAQTRLAAGRLLSRLGPL